MHPFHVASVFTLVDELFGFLSTGNTMVIFLLALRATPASANAYLVGVEQRFVVAPFLLHRLLLDSLVYHALLVFFQKPLLMEPYLLLDLPLVAVACIQKFTCLLGCDIGQLLCPLLLEGESLDPVFELLVFEHLLLQDLLLLAHFYPRQHCITDLRVAASSEGVFCVQGLTQSSRADYFKATRVSSSLDCYLLPQPPPWALVLSE
jgi:hypothetical protein